ncbi:putative zinc-binding metallopeptidase [Polaribacter sp. Asnod6-C07]|uniref:zinc-binding metallopeptidase family protein n=1 Tax=Polaribacter sp. Asnod6-C07 TaxID=3160582 RepID=UPI00386FAF1F
MNIFQCPNCSNTVYFENTSCENCESTLGYHLDSDNFKIPDNNSLKFCKNYIYDNCNWLINVSDENDFCTACQLNRTIPNKRDLDDFNKWEQLEFAKHRLIYQLYKLKLPLVAKNLNDKGIAFDFLSENNKENKLTGHADGVVTIILSEADAVHRAQLKKLMNEPYRTLLGHFRHEIGHYYWMLFFEKEHLQSFRNLFGDERKDYGKSLEAHYKNGEQKDWNVNFISNYASSHPWEDWAETWAHYLHIMDTLETASSLGISFTKSKTILSKDCVSNFDDPYKIKDFRKIFDASITLTSAANSLNRAMGLPDIYPFVIPEPVYFKLEFIHNLLFNNNWNLK